MGFGALFTALIGTGFSVSFILSGLWLNPLIPMAACAVSILVSIVWAVIARSRFARHFRLAYGPFISRPCLRAVIRAGKPLTSQTVKSGAAVIAIKKADIAEAKEPEDQRIPQVLDFHEKVSMLSKKNGATVIGAEGGMVTICFGSPLEKVLEAHKKMAARYKGSLNKESMSYQAFLAADFACELTANPDYKSWHFGIDLGNCTFAWTALSGYFAIGNPVQNARKLSNLACKQKSRIIISSSMSDALSEQPSKKTDLLKMENTRDRLYLLRE